MRDYHDCTQMYIGTSDKATLTMLGYNGNCELAFGEDASYYAYIVDQDTDIPTCYKHVFSTKRWLLIVDDYGDTAHFNADVIEVYRCGLRGCIIKLIYDDDSFYQQHIELDFSDYKKYL